MKTISDFINLSPKESQKKLREMRACLRKVAPKATEEIKWRSIAFLHERILFTFAGFKHHIGFYPTPSAITFFKKELEAYKTARGSIQFPLDKKLPITLIQKIAKFRIKELKEKDAKWM